jgi:CheY-like chemotaxis protein
LTDGNYHCLTVRDNGSGIAPEILDRVFDPFFTTKAVGQGTGLGLSVVHGIARDLRGCVTLSSQPNQGTSVSVYLPESDQEMAEISEELPCIAGKGHILVVDDEKPIIHLLETILQKQGYRVTTTQQSNTALSLIREAPARFDLLITDKTMPSLSGLDLIETLYNEGIKIPTILMTGYFQEGDEIHHPGVSRYLKKPLNILQFNVAVAECISAPLNTSNSNNE